MAIARYRIHWISKITFVEGHSEPMDYDIAESWIKEIMPKYPDLKHWLVLEQ